MMLCPPLVFVGTPSIENHKPSNVHAPPLLLAGTQFSGPVNCALSMWPKVYVPGVSLYRFAVMTASSRCGARMAEKGVSEPLGTVADEARSSALLATMQCGICGFEEMGG